MSDSVGIVAYGAYIPQLRLRRSAIAAAHAWVSPSGRGKGERAFASWDEDAVTMAVEAARDARGNRSGDPKFSAVLLASTSAPFADRQNSGIVANALGLPDSVISLDIGGSLRAGASAAIAGLALAQANEGEVLVAAAEHRGSKPGSSQEMTNGDAGAALIFGRENVIARVLATNTITRDFVDHFRAAGESHDYGWEERWVRDEGYSKLVPAAVDGLLRKVNLTAEDVATFILPTPLNGIGPALSKKLKLADTALADGLNERIGFTGAAHSLLLLANALETAKPGDRILVASFANGCDALLIEVTPEIEKFRPQRGVSGWLANGKSVDDYMRFLSFNGEINFEWGARAEFGNKYALTTEYRYGRDMLAFIGGRDKQTGVVQFPKTPMAVAPGAKGKAEYEDVPMADVPARVVSFTADWLTYHPSPPFYFGLVQFENGARVLMEFVDVAGGDLDVGASVGMTFRIKEIDRVRNYRHYFWKATPVASEKALAEAAE